MLGEKRWGECVGWNPKEEYGVIQFFDGWRAYVFPYSIGGLGELYEGEKVEIVAREERTYVFPFGLRPIEEHLEIARDLILHKGDLESAQKLIARAETFLEELHPSRRLVMHLKIVDLEKTLKIQEKALEILGLLLEINKEINKARACPEEDWWHSPAAVKTAQLLLEARNELRQHPFSLLWKRWSRLQREFSALHEKSLESFPQNRL